MEVRIVGRGEIGSVPETVGIAVVDFLDDVVLDDWGEAEVAVVEVVEVVGVVEGVEVALLSACSQPEGASC